MWLLFSFFLPAAGLKNYSSITCDFEEIEICYWTQDANDDFDWTWQNAADHDLDNTGPSGDHTTGSPLGTSRWRRAFVRSAGRALSLEKAAEYRCS